MRRCPDGGGPFPEDTYDGLCPRCVARVALASRPEEGPSVPRLRLILGMAKAAFHDAWFAGLLQFGLNLTGGEPLIAGETVFELIRYAHALGLQVRLNTNSWWGTRGEHLIGGQRFSTPEHLVGHLKDLGLSLFALSCDARLEQDARAFDSLAGTIRACEAQAMPYQVVCTGCGSDRLLDLFARLHAATGRDLRQVVPIRMEMVDIGGAAPRGPESAPADTNLAQVTRRSECARRGFYHPLLLHVDPAGGVRSCLCASGLQNMGHLSRQSLIEIINDFPNNPVSRAFSAGQLEEVATALFVPAVWKRFRHPCTASAVLAGLIQAAARFSDENAHSAGHERLRLINERLACAMNLACH